MERQNLFIAINPLNKSYVRSLIVKALVLDIAGPKLNTNLKVSKKNQSLAAINLRFEKKKKNSGNLKRNQN